MALTQIPLMPCSSDLSDFDSAFALTYLYLEV